MNTSEIIGFIIAALSAAFLIPKGSKYLALAEKADREKRYDDVFQYGVAGVYTFGPGAAMALLAVGFVGKWVFRSFGWI